MPRSPRPVWSVNLGLLVFLALLALATVSLAYQSGGPPSFIGHSSEEFTFSYVQAATNCFSNSSPTCTAVCPAGSFLVSGFCGSIPDPVNGIIPPQWTWIGRVGGDSLSYTCVDEAHIPNSNFVAAVYCMQGVLN